MSEDSMHLSRADSSTRSVVASSSWDRETETTPVYAVISAVADATGSDGFELPPLNDVIDPEALNTLFLSESATSEKRVSFEYLEYEVTVRGSGAVRVRPVDEA